VHHDEGKWDTGGSCAGKEDPKPKGYVWRASSGRVCTSISRRIRTHVFSHEEAEEAKRFVFMDILPMSASRVDGHPGPYRGKQSKEAIAKLKAAKSKYPASPGLPPLVLARAH